MINKRHLIYGEVVGTIMTTSKEKALENFSQIEGRDLKFIDVNLDNAIIKKDTNQTNLNEFKIKPYAALTDQDVTLKYNELKYKINFPDVIIQQIKIIEKIQTVDNDYYFKFKGNFYSFIQYYEDVPIIEPEEIVLDNVNELNEIDLEPTSPISHSKKGCFGNKSNSNNQTTTANNRGCFSPGYKNFYDLNKRDIKSKINQLNTESKNYWSNQIRRQKDYINKPSVPYSGVSNSFERLLAIFLLTIVCIIINYDFWGFGNSNIKAASGIFHPFWLPGTLIMGFALQFAYYKRISINGKKRFTPQIRSTFSGIMTRFLLFLIFLYIIFTYALSFSTTDDFDYDRDRVDDTEVVEIPDETSNSDDSDSSSVNMTKVIKRTHQWSDFNSNNYEKVFNTKVDEYSAGKKFINNMNLNYTGSDFWTKLYSRVTNYELDKNNMVFNMYKELSPTSKSNLSSIERLEAIITSVQTIPYYLVHEGSCQSSISSSKFSREYHFSGEPCIANVKYGLAAPSQFSGNFKGDCDTRSLFLYIILKRIGYDVAILVSEKYGHAILGVNIPGNGKSINFRGKRFLTVETTAEGWKIGQLPPNCGNTRYWRVALN